MKLQYDSSTTEESEDDMYPIVIMTGREAFVHPEMKKDLRRITFEQCDFCDEAFLNRYDALVHNASHIIIPLAKQTTYQCPECLFHFTSPAELQSHSKSKHNIGVKEEADVGAIEPIRNRIRFEDEIMDSKEGLLNDLLTNCKVDVNLYDVPWIGDVAGDGVVHHDELMTPRTVKCRRCTKTFPNSFELIQHEATHIKIRKPRPLLCEYCERFIPGNYQSLRKHITEKHAYGRLRHRKQKTCKKCGLKYNNYYKHINIYHVLFHCDICGQGFEEDIQKQIHLAEHLTETKCSYCDLVSTAVEIKEHENTSHNICHTTDMKVCDLCCMFLKNSHSFRYVIGKDISEIGSRLCCDKCGNKFFVLKKVTRVHKGEGRVEGVRERKNKQLTNFGRLRNIQQRLKMINKLSKV